MRPSGVEWIGDIPDEWKCLRLAYIADQSHPYALGDGDHGLISADSYVDSGIPFIRVQNLGWTPELQLDSLAYISSKDNDKISGSVLRPGDVLFAKTGATIGKAGIVPDDMPVANTTSHVGKLTVSSGFYPRYIYYAISSQPTYRQFWDIAALKSTRPELSIADIEKIKLAVPGSYYEQRMIAQLLDGECLAINNSISLIDRQLTTLERYKSSLIYEAVTKGLDRGVPTKPSGVEWIGNIPEGWRTLRGKYIFSMYGGSISEDHLFLEDRPGLKEIVYLKVSNLNNSTNGFEIDEYPTCYTDLAIKQFSTPLILIPKRGMAIQTNKVRISNRPCLIDPNLMAIRTKGNIRYYAYFLQCINLINIADVTTIPQINNKHLNELRLPVPPASEQKRIADYLDDRCSRIDHILDLKRQQVEVLRRRRQSLIYEYVTGKRRVGQEA